MLPRCSNSVKSSIDLSACCDPNSRWGIEPTKGHRVDPSAVALRPDVPNLVGRPDVCPLTWQSKQVDPAHPVSRQSLSVGRGIELLLWKLRHQETQAFQLLGIKNAIEQFVEVVDGHHLPRDTSPRSGRRGQVHGGRELGKELVGQVEVDVEPFESGELLNRLLRDDHPAHFVLWVRQR